MSGFVKGLAWAVENLHPVRWRYLMKHDFNTWLLEHTVLGGC